MNEGLILFVHGLGGNASSTWGKFPELIKQDPALSEYDTDFFEYPTSFFGLPFLSKPPKIQMIANALSTQINTKFERYKNIIIVCHSLGGLIAKRYLIEEVKQNSALRIRALLLYAVPNEGTRLEFVAKLISWRNIQLRQLCKNSDFLNGINEDWAYLKINEKMQVKYVLAAKDNVVDENSARASWGNQIEVVVNCGHIDVVKPQKPDDISFLILKSFVLPADKPKPMPTSAFGVKFNKIIWKHYYLDNFDFRSEIEYYLQSNSESPIVDLPPHEAGWFGHDIEYTFEAVIYGENKHSYTINNKYFFAKNIQRNDLNGRDCKITRLNWQFTVAPPIARKTVFNYGIIIQTKNTEKEAFNGDGSLAGMSSPYPVDSIISEIFAPNGYSFKDKGVLVRDSTGVNVECNITKPVFSDNDTKITWVVEQPSPTVRYLVRIFLVKRDR